MVGIFVGATLIIVIVLMELIDYIVYKVKLKRYYKAMHSLYDEAYAQYVADYKRVNVPYVDFDYFAYLQSENAPEGTPKEPYYSFEATSIIIALVISCLIIGAGCFSLHCSKESNTALYEKYKNLQTEYNVILDEIEDKSTIPTIMREIDDYNLYIQKQQISQEHFITNAYLTDKYDWNDLSPIKK